MALAVGASHFYGLAQAGAWNSISGIGTFNYMPGHPSGLKLTKPLVFSKQARGMTKRFGRYGHQMGDGNIIGDYFHEGWSKLLTTAFARTTTPGTNFNSHVFVVPDATGAFDNVQGLVLYDHKDLKTYRHLSAFAKQLTWNFSEDPFIGFNAAIISASRSRISAVTPTFGALAPATPFGDGATLGLTAALTVNGNSYGAAWYAKSLQINITVPTDLAKSITSQTAVKALRTGNYVVDGQWTWHYSANDALAEDWLTSYDNELTADLTFTLLGTTIPTSSPATPYTLQFAMPKAYVKGEDPVVAGPGAFDQTFSFEAGRDSLATNSPITITVKNNETLP